MSLAKPESTVYDPESALYMTKTGAICDVTGQDQKPEVDLQTKT